MLYFIYKILIFKNFFFSEREVHQAPGDKDIKLFLHRHINFWQTSKSAFLWQDFFA